jgi:hypothetical protein
VDEAAEEIANIVRPGARLGMKLDRKGFTLPITGAAPPAPEPELSAGEAAS